MIKVEKINNIGVPVKVCRILMLAVSIVFFCFSFANAITTIEKTSRSFVPLADSIPVIAKITTVASNLISLGKGDYTVSLKVFKTKGTVVPQFTTQIEEPYNNLSWNIAGLKDDEWVTLSQDLTLDSNIVNSKFSVSVDNNFGQGWGQGSFYIDDIKFDKKVVTALKPISKINYSIYPNPFYNDFKVNAPKGSRISLYSLNGNLVYKTVFTSSDALISLPQLNYGVYLININYQGNESNFKLIKTN